MHKIVRYVLAAGLGILGSLSAYTGKTFFAPRHPLDIGVFTLRHMHCQDPCDRRHGFTTQLFVQDATNHDALARYFMPQDRSTIRVQGATGTGPFDVSGTWLGIGSVNPGDSIIGGQGLFLNQFASTLAMHAHYRRFGANLHAFMYLPMLHSRFWFSLQAPLVQIETKITVNEYDISGNVTTREEIFPFESFMQGTPPLTLRLERATFATMLNAHDGLVHPFWQYSRFEDKLLKQAGIADLKLCLGLTPWSGNDHILHLYATCIIPTGYKPTARNVFEPLVGNGRHTGFGAGTAGSYSMHWDCNHELRIDGTLEYTYLLRANQRRSCDLVGHGPWSRYLSVFEPYKEPTVLKPGINFFTPVLSILPGSSINLLGCVRYSYAQRYNIQAGYNFWWKNHERAHVAKEGWQHQISLAHADFKTNFTADEDDTSFTLFSAFGSKISQHINTTAVDNATVLLQQSDLDMNSATAPATHSHTAYVTLGYQPCSDNIHMLELGSSYEWAGNNAALAGWSIWASIRASW